MSIPVSSIPAVKAALVAGIQAQVTAVVATPADVGVYYDEPGRDKKLDRIEVGEVVRQVGPFALVGDGSAGAFDEEYRITVTITSRGGGDHAAIVDARAYALLAAAETFVRGDRTCGGRLLEFRPEQSTSTGSWAFDAQGTAIGRLVTITLPIYCHAVI